MAQLSPRSVFPCWARHQNTTTGFISSSCLQMRVRGRHLFSCPCFLWTPGPLLSLSGHVGRKPQVLFQIRMCTLLINNYTGMYDSISLWKRRSWKDTLIRALENGVYPVWEGLLIIPAKTWQLTMHMNLHIQLWGTRDLTSPLTFPATHRHSRLEEYFTSENPSLSWWALRALIIAVSTKRKLFWIKPFSNVTWQRLPTLL